MRRDGGAEARARRSRRVEALSRLLLLLAAAVLTACGGTAAGGDPAAPAPDPWVRLVVLHTNDVHGGILPRSPDLAGIEASEDVGGSAALASFVARERAEATARGAHVLLLDGGDVWRGTPEGDLTKGDLVVDAFSRLGYDAVALGNHDLDLGVENAKRLATAASFPWVSANVVETATGKPPAWLKPSVVVERGGLRVGIVGMSPPETAKIVVNGDRLGLSFRSETAAAAAAAKDLEGRADVIVFLTHLGPDRDRGILDAVPQAPLVVGGHSHTRLAKPIVAGPKGASWIVQAGTGCVLAGRVALRVRRDTKEVVLEESRLVPLVPSAVGRDPAMEKFLAERLDALPFLKEFATPVTRLTAPLERSRENPWVSSPAGNALADAMRAATGADAAVMNRGGIRVTLPKGVVTRRDLHLLMPFENTVVVVPLTGAELRAALATSIAGEAYSLLEVSGIEARHKTSDGSATKHRLTSLSVGGSPVDDAKTYRVATNSFLSGGGDGFGSFRKPDTVDTGRLLRDVVAEWMSARPELTPDATPRIGPE